MDENKEVSKKYGEVWEGVKKKLERSMVAKKGKKNRFEPSDDLPINKPIKLRLLTIIIRCVFSEGGKFYPQILLDDALYDLV